MIKNFFTHNRPFVSYALAIVLALVLIPFVIARAESVVWSELQPNLHATGGSGRAQLYLNNAMVQVTYNVRVSEVDEAGAKIRTLIEGESVPINTRVLFEFVPHVFSDIYWFGTGHTYDTPYGDWRPGAAAPPEAERCLPKNQYGASVSDPANGELYDLYAALSVIPPSKSLTVNATGANCTTASDGVSKICTFTEATNVSAQFNFNSTLGEFYSGYINNANKRHVSPGGGYCGKSSIGHQMHLVSPMGDDYALNVATQVIPFTLVVKPESLTPEPPVVTPENRGTSGGASCTTGATYTLSMTSNDPAGGNIRYGVDWDANGTIDQFVPGSGYVPSGTTLSTSRTFSAAGSKTVKVLAQNVDGFTSAWTTVTFNCQQSQDVSLDDIDSGDDFTSTTGNNDGGESNLSIRAVPTLVRSGESVKIHWSATNVASCEVIGNGNSWTGNLSPTGGESSNPITGRATYTLSCLDIDEVVRNKSVTINVLPVFQED